MTPELHHELLHSQAAALAGHVPREHLGAMFSQALGSTVRAEAARDVVHAWLTLHTLDPRLDHCDAGWCAFRRFGLPEGEIPALSGVRHLMSDLPAVLATLQTIHDPFPDADGAARLLVLAGLFELVIGRDCLVDGAVSVSERVGPRLRAMVSHLTGRRPLRRTPARGLLRHLGPDDADALLRAFAMAHVDWQRSDSFADPTDSWAPVTTFRFTSFCDSTAEPVEAFLDHPRLPITALFPIASNDTEALHALLTDHARRLRP